MFPKKLVALASTAFLFTLSGMRAATIVLPPEASPLETLAAREVQRYVYLRTGELSPIKTGGHEEKGQTILVARRDHRAAASVDRESAWRSASAELGPQQFVLKTQVSTPGAKSLWIIGGDDVGTLYGAYAFAERLGARFYLDGDVIPDRRIKLDLSGYDVRAQPLFPLRGLVPFHDFPEGPDWWTVEEWKSVLAQAVKMRMNFVGLHTYPKSALGPEPTVWIGLQEDVNADGTVKLSDATSWHNTQRFAEYGCYRPEKTSDFSFGGAELFESDDYGPEVNGSDDFPFPKTPEASVALMNRTGDMLRRVCDYARSHGIKTCVGTEGPLNIPEVVKARLLGAGLNPTNPATVQKLYEGIFTRIQRAFPVDYYWIWGHEGEINQEMFLTDMRSAVAAAEATKPPFGLGICGWGWITENFQALHQALPRGIAFSAINLSVGNSPVSPNFAELEQRPRWAIPWFEDDPAMITPQLWVGRMRKDAADALKYGCTGLMGLHWRTRVIGPNVSALAQAAWDQSGWNPPQDRAPAANAIQVLGGQVASFLNSPISGTDQAPLYQDVRFNLGGYQLALPNGRYAVTLKFCEPAYAAAGKRVFGVRLQGREVIQHLDVFARVGQNAALDLTFKDVVVADGCLRIEFVKEVEFPCVAALAVQGPTASRKLNCGGPAYQDYEADPGPEQVARFLPSLDFYEDWAAAQFGRDLAGASARLLAALDGRFPRPCNWNRGPGVISVNPQPWEKVKSQYQFVDEFARLRPQVRGAGERERFDWWLNTFRYTEAMARVGCARGELDRAMAELSKQTDPEVKRRLVREKALPLRLQLAVLLGEMYGYLLATVHNTSELGMLVNVEQQAMLRTQLLTAHDKTIRDILGQDLPAEAKPRKNYCGAERIVLPTRRPSLPVGESLQLKVLILAEKQPKEAAAYWRPLGRGRYSRIPLAHVARGVYGVKLPPVTSQGVEYYVQLTGAGGNLVRYPASAPGLSLTVVAEGRP